METPSVKMLEVTMVTVTMAKEHIQQWLAEYRTGNAKNVIAFAAAL